MARSQHRVAFVTGYIGQGPTSIPTIRKDVDSYFITNNRKIAEDSARYNGFTGVILINVPIVDSDRSCGGYLTNTMSSKPLKVFPQSFLEKQYDFVVWYDLPV